MSSVSPGVKLHEWNRFGKTVHWIKAFTYAGRWPLPKGQVKASKPCQVRCVIKSISAQGNNTIFQPCILLFGWGERISSSPFEKSDDVCDTIWAKHLVHLLYAIGCWGASSACLCASVDLSRVICRHLDSHLGFQNTQSILDERMPKRKPTKPTKHWQFPGET